MALSIPIKQFIIAFACACAGCRGPGSQYFEWTPHVTPPADSLLFPVFVRKDGWPQHGYIDSSGKIIVEPLLWSAPPFSDGYALVTFDAEEVRISNGTFEYHPSPAVLDYQQGHRSSPPVDRQQCFIDAYGKVTSPPFKVDSGMGSLSDGIALVVQGGACGYIRPDGSWLVRPSFPAAGYFSEGRALVRSGGIDMGRGGILFPGKVGYVDKTGHMIIGAQFDDARNFHEGLAAVTLDGKKWGYIDRFSKMVIAPQFTDVHDFHEGLSSVSTASGSGYIDPAGKWIIPPKYDLGE